MYFAGWLSLVVITLAVSLAAFLWGLKSGQFSDQDRARYLPLGSDLLDSPPVWAGARKRRAQTAGLLLIVTMCVAAFGAAVVLSLHNR